LRPVELERFAAMMRMLKARTDRSYEALAKRTGISSSSLHRYCAGTKIPSDFGAAQRFARECGATQAELHDLHRFWALADAGRREQPEREQPDVTAESSVPDEAEHSAPETRETSTDRVRMPTRRLAKLAGAAVVLVAGVAAWMTWVTGSGGSRTMEGPLLMSAACPPVVGMGQHDECVREVQQLLSKVGAKIDVDGDFGPATLRRVIAFQVLAGLQARGVVDEPTKQALYDQKIRMNTWSPQRVEQRIRQVFPEEPDRAVGIARCQSFLDPLHVLNNTNGTRNWGVFQLSDKLLDELGGNPLKAYDPEWNIQGARRAWSKHHDFRDWEHCDQPYRTSPPST
jgi:helix-turn-helix protein/putative peptidoglycan binding protein